MFHHPLISWNEAVWLEEVFHNNGDFRFTWSKYKQKTKLHKQGTTTELFSTKSAQHTWPSKPGPGTIPPVDPNLLH